MGQEPHENAEDRRLRRQEEPLAWLGRLQGVHHLIVTCGAPTDGDSSRLTTKQLDLAVKQAQEVLEALRGEQRLRLARANPTGPSALQVAVERARIEKAPTEGEGLEPRVFLIERKLETSEERRARVWNEHKERLEKQGRCVGSGFPFCEVELPCEDHPEKGQTEGRSLHQKLEADGRCTGWISEGVFCGGELPCGEHAYSVASMARRIGRGEDAGKGLAEQEEEAPWMRICRACGAHRLADEWVSETGPDGLVCPSCGVRRDSAEPERMKAVKAELEGSGDRGVLLEMFKRAGLEFTENDAVIEIEAGYIGFVSTFTFNTNGSLQSVKAYE